MDGREYKLILALPLLFLLFFLTPLKANVKESDNREIILLISSYDPTSLRISNFFNDFQDASIQDGDKYAILFESLYCQDVSECDEWPLRLTSVLDKYKNNNLKAIVFIGQEAWASYNMLEDVNLNIPIFVAFAGEKGISLINGDYSYDHPPLVQNFVDSLKAKNIHVGGQFFNLDISKNIEIIKTMFSSVTNIALITDNSYGGIVLKAMVIEAFKHYPEYNLIFIDGQKHSQEEAQKIVRELPEGTAILVGTWLIDKKGAFFSKSNLAYLLKENNDIPAFSLSGGGLGVEDCSLVGGYFPVYKYDAKILYQQLIRAEKRATPIKVILKSQYTFDNDVLIKFGIKKDYLPRGSVVISSFDEKIKNFRKVIYATSIIALAFICFSVFTLLMYRNNRKLKNILEKKNKDLILARDGAIASEKAKSSFLANMSHEIRTPLNAIIGFSSLMSEEDTTPEERLEYKSIIEQNSRSLLKLVNDILDISRLESGKIKFSMEEIDIVSLCKKAVDSFRPSIKHGVEVRFISTKDKFVIVTDQYRLLQIINNFLNNANKFTDSGYIELSLNICTEQNMLQYIVTDTGCGIPKENRDKIFKRFEKFSANQTGFGLGLAIASQLAKSVNGKVFLDEEYNLGTRIIYERPIKIELEL